MIISTFCKSSTCNQPFLKLYTGKSRRAICWNHLLRQVIKKQRPLIGDIPVFPTDRGWQPVQISSWWWCICWNETPSPAPVSGGLCKLPCISPSSSFYLRRRRETKHNALSFSFALSFAATSPLHARETASCRPGPALSAQSIFIRQFLNPRLCLQICKCCCFISLRQLYYSEFQRASNEILIRRREKKHAEQEPTKQA